MRGHEHHHQPDSDLVAPVADVAALVPVAVLVLVVLLLVAVVVVVSVAPVAILGRKPWLRQLACVCTVQTNKRQRHQKG